MKVRIFEVGPRDGLQNESATLSVDQRLKFISLLADAGHRDIEVGAFVNHHKIPQMAETHLIVRQLKAQLSYRPWVLVPNEHGFEDARRTKITNIAVFTAASETFNKKNINATIDESFERFNEFVPLARKSKMLVRGYVSTCFGCPYEGQVKPAVVLKVTERLLKLGVHEISIGDTIGVANPTQVTALTKPLLKLAGPKKLALHFHDTRGTALANILAGLDSGCMIFDSSSGGLGGCPYAPGASGNVATDDLVFMLDGMGVTTGIDLEAQRRASLYVQDCLGKRLPSKYLQAGPLIPR